MQVYFLLVSVKSIISVYHYKDGGEEAITEGNGARCIISATGGNEGAQTYISVE